MCDPNSSNNKYLDKMCMGGLRICGNQMEQRSKENRVTMLSVHHIVNTISNLQVHEKQIAIGWLGNASFVLKTLSGTVIYLDLYLSDLGERVYGKEFKRLMPPLLSASQVKADLLISTHHHEDHFDTDIVPEIMQSGDILFVGSPTCIELCQKMGIESNRLIELQIGKEYSYKDIRVITVYADHGDLAPDAVGIVLIVLDSSSSTLFIKAPGSPPCPGNIQ
ncbi:MBL fold metallo-hydrolase [Verrucomicrobiota bacterium]